MSTSISTAWPLKGNSRHIRAALRAAQLADLGIAVVEKQVCLVAASERLGGKPGGLTRITTGLDPHYGYSAAECISYAIRLAFALGYNPEQKIGFGDGTIQREVRNISRMHEPVAMAPKTVENAPAYSKTSTPKVEVLPPTPDEFTTALNNIAESVV